MNDLALYRHGLARPAIGFALLAVLAVSACAPPAGTPGDSAGAASPGPAADPAELVDPDCAWPTRPDTLFADGGAILQRWSFPLDGVHSRPVLPNDRELIAYRRAIRERGAVVRHPELQRPDSVSPDAEGVWRDEAHNNRLAYSGAVGVIGPLTCLDALLFAEQNRRVSQLEHPTEFLASVLVDDRAARMTVIFGAGHELFVPRSVYGFDVVDDYRAGGWRYWYALHNHTLQARGDGVVLGVPVPSTSDVSLARTLARDRGLESLRVTNGFYTFSASIDALSEFRGR